jgi:hypothetical protein
VVTTGFSPPSPQSPLALCYEANVVTFKGSNVLSSNNLKDLTAATLPVGAQNGWALFDFTSSLSGTVNAHRLVSVNPVATFNGLPVIGFMAETFNNGSLNIGTATAPSLVQSSYGGNFVHKTTRLIN